jgi:hypothetical protein
MSTFDEYISEIIERVILKTYDKLIDWNKLSHILALKEVLIEDEVPYYMIDNLILNLQKRHFENERWVSIDENEILNPLKVGATLKDLSNKKIYTLLSNKFYENINDKIKNLKNIEYIGEKQNLGYLIELIDKNGKIKYIIKYAKKII